MVTDRYRITNEEYIEHVNNDYKTLKEWAENKLPIQYFIGYGVYGIRLAHDEDGCYIEFEKGSSCD